MDEFDIVVAGRGPAGLAAAAALACNGARVAVVAPAAPANSREDTRTAALFRGSLALLKNLGAWQQLASATAPLLGIRIIDDGERLLRAPEVMFGASELGLDDFGANVPQEALTAALRSVVDANVDITMFDGSVGGIEIGPSDAAVKLASGASLRTRLVVAADGRNSVCRRAAGITAQTWDYPQIAIAAHFSHSRDHRGISTEFHRPAGPCTVVPMPGRRSSLVWVERRAIAERLAELDDHAFVAALERRLHGVLGSVHDLGPRRLFPLGGLKAAALGQSRVALVGEAGHTLPPIGAQGLNLGFRDVAVLADMVGKALADRQNIGGEALTRAYDEARRNDVAVRTTVVDLLNRSLLSDMLPANLARGLSLHAIGGIAALKRQVMRAGFEPSGALPPLMQGL